MGNESNLQKLTAAGIIPKGYDKLSDAEKATINGLTAEEVKAIISASSKFSPEFLKKHAPHGMAY